MTKSKNELFELINNLSADQIQLVNEYIKRLNEEEDVLNKEAYNYVIQNYSETLKGLTEK